MREAAAVDPSSLLRPLWDSTVGSVDSHLPEYNSLLDQHCVVQRELSHQLQLGKKPPGHLSHPSVHWHPRRVVVAQRAHAARAKQHNYVLLDKERAVQEKGLERDLTALQRYSEQMPAPGTDPGSSEGDTIPPQPGSFGEADDAPGGEGGEDVRLALRRAELELLRCIVLREDLLARLQTAFDKHVRRRTEHPLMVPEVVSLLESVQAATGDVVEAIRAWQGVAGEPKPCIWHGVDYVTKMRQDVEPYLPSRALGWQEEEEEEEEYEDDLEEDEDEPAPSTGGGTSPAEEGGKAAGRDHGPEGNHQSPLAPAADGAAVPSRSPLGRVSSQRGRSHSRSRSRSPSPAGLPGRSSPSPDSRRLSPTDSVSSARLRPVGSVEEQASRRDLWSRAGARFAEPRPGEEGHREEGEDEGGGCGGGCGGCGGETSGEGDDGRGQQVSAAAANGENTPASSDAPSVPDRPPTRHGERSPSLGDGEEGSPRSPSSPHALTRRDSAVLIGQQGVGGGYSLLGSRSVAGHSLALTAGRATLASPQDASQVVNRLASDSDRLRRLMTWHDDAVQQMRRLQAEIDAPLVREARRRHAEDVRARQGVDIGRVYQRAERSSADTAIPRDEQWDSMLTAAVARPEAPVHAPRDRWSVRTSPSKGRGRASAAASLGPATAEGQRASTSRLAGRRRKGPPSRRTEGAPGRLEPLQPPLGRPVRARAVSQPGIRSVPSHTRSRQGGGGGASQRQAAPHSAFAGSFATHRDRASPPQRPASRVHSGGSGASGGARGSRGGEWDHYRTLSLPLPSGRELETLQELVPPPPAAVLSLAATRILLAQGDRIPSALDWEAGLAVVMSDPEDFVARMNAYSPTAIPRFKVRALRSFVSQPLFRPEAIAPESTVAAKLCAWVLRQLGSQQRYVDWLQEAGGSGNDA